MRVGRIRGLITCMLFAAAGCESNNDVAPRDAAGDHSPDARADAGAPQAIEPFSMVLIADPHITGESERDTRLQAVVEWVNGEAAGRNIELALVLGDIGWGVGIQRAKEMLDELEVPYVPLKGDNVVVEGGGEEFETVYGPHYEQLGGLLEGWRRADFPVFSPLLDQQIWLNNVAFHHRGLHFVGLDWSARGAVGLAAEMGNLHDFEGGTLPWLKAELESHSSSAADSFVMASHIPMHLGAFTLDGMAILEAALAEKRPAVYANLAGHVHQTYQASVGEGLYEVFVTDATWDDENTIDVVRIEGDAAGYRYQHELVEVPW